VEYLEAQLTLADLTVPPVNSCFGTFVTFGPEDVHGFRQLGAQPRLVCGMQRPHLQQNVGKLTKVHFATTSGCWRKLTINLLAPELFF